MTTELELFKTLASWLEEGRAFTLATVVKVEGSAPRHLGARMLVSADGASVGTVGGGALEQQVITEARAALEAGEPRLLSYRLKADLGMACGGSAAVYVEPMLPPERLFIFGGGHVGKALSNIATGLGFAVTVVDERAEFAAPGRFPGARGWPVQSYDPGDWGELGVDARSYCVVATHGHGTDFTVVRALMALDPAPRYVGMIGSRTKRRTVEKQLREDGVPEARLPELHTPMGLSIGAETPAEIAVSIAAELVQVRRAQTPTKEDQPG